VADQIGEVVAPVTLVFFDGTETPATSSFDVLLGIKNAYGIDRSYWSKGPTIQLHLPFHDGPGDDYVITAAVNGFRDTGDFVTANPKVHNTLKLMLIPSGAKISFCSWDTLKSKYPRASYFLGLGDDDGAARARYLELQKSKPAALACFLNLITAMMDINLNGKSPLDFIKGICWDSTFAQDRFFGYADPAIIPAIQAAAAEGDFAEEKDCAAFHKGSTCSYKQTTYDYSNVQLTFHEGDTQLIDGVKCVKIEPDMDLYKSLLNHGLMEVLPNLSTHGLTNPVDILSLRWLDSADDNESNFDPGYNLV
jgi:hypothetical protein